MLGWCTTLNRLFTCPHAPCLSWLIIQDNGFILPLLSWVRDSQQHSQGSCPEHWMRDLVLPLQTVPEAPHIHAPLHSPLLVRVRQQLQQCYFHSCVVGKQRESQTTTFSSNFIPKHLIFIRWKPPWTTWEKYLKYNLPLCSFAWVFQNILLPCLSWWIWASW